MKIGYIGLGKMGYGMVEKMLEKGHSVVAFNRSPEKVDSIKNKGAIPAYTISEIFENLWNLRLCIFRQCRWFAWLSIYNDRLSTKAG
jgi:6-phosphogluconate dehydrogenase